MVASARSPVRLVEDVVVEEGGSPRSSGKKTDRMMFRATHKETTTKEGEEENDQEDGTESSSERRSALLALARQQYHEGAFEKARETCLQIGEDGMDPERRLLLGAVSFKLGRLAECVEHNLACLASDARFAEAYSNLANATKELGDTRLAKRLYLEAIRLKPGFTDAYSNLAAAHLALGETRDAIETYLTALLLDPDNPAIRCHVGALFRADGKHVAARQCLVECCRRNPDYAPGWCALAACEKDQGRLAQAAKCYQEAIRLAPDAAETHSNLGNVLKEQALLKEAIVAYNKALEIDPDFAVAHGNLASCLLEAGQTARAIEVFHKALQLEPDFPDAYNNLGNALREAGRLEEAVSCYRRALELRPDHAHAHNNLGNAFKDRGLVREAIASYETATRLAPRFAAAHSNLGLVLKERGEVASAIAHYRRAIAIDPNFVDAYSNLGNALKDAGRVDDSIECYTAAIYLKPDFADAYSNLASAYKDAGRNVEAVACYRRALQIRPDFADAFANLVHSLVFVCDWSSRSQDFKKLRAILQSQLAGPGLLRNKASSSSSFAAAAEKTKPTSPSDKVESDQDEHQVVVSSSEQSDSPTAVVLGPPPAKKPRTVLLQPEKETDGGELAPCPSTSLQDVAAPCPSTSLQDVAQRDSPQNRAVQRGRVPSVQPFHTLVYPIPNADIKRIAMRYADRAMFNAQMYELPMPLFETMDAEQAARLLPQAPVVGNKSSNRLRVGYVSSDLGNHPLAHLMQSVFGMHDRRHFDVICYSLSPDDGSQWRRKIEAEVETFVDMSQLTARDAALAVRSHDVDVLVNLNGYTKGARNEIFALQPAPVQASYMGFCGTLGASYVQYLVADSVVVPKEHEEWYTERVVRLPHCYFVNDHAQSARYMLDRPGCAAPGGDMSDPQVERQRRVSDVATPGAQPQPTTTTVGPQTNGGTTTQLPTRAQYGVPKDATFVFANFNQIYKIDPGIFDVWCSILRRVEGSILWLLRFPPMGEANIRAEARKRGVDDAVQLHFTAVSPKDEHIKRGALADLFLDTPQCNAHTTGCDILWGGCPMITTRGTKMATRVAASLLQAVGAPELVAEDERAYEDLAVQLATDKARYARVRAKIERARRGPDLAPLWDTMRWVRNLEAGFDAVWHRHVRGLPPDHIDVNDVGSDGFDRDLYRPYVQPEPQDTATKSPGGGCAGSDRAHQAAVLVRCGNGPGALAVGPHLLANNGGAPGDAFLGQQKNSSPGGALLVPGDAVGRPSPASIHLRSVAPGVVGVVPVGPGVSPGLGVCPGPGPVVPVVLSHPLPGGLYPQPVLDHRCIPVAQPFAVGAPVIGPQPAVPVVPGVGGAPAYHGLPPYLAPPPVQHQLRAPTHLIHQANLYPAPLAPTPPHHFLNTPGGMFNPHTFVPVARLQTDRYNHHMLGPFPDHRHFPAHDPNNPAARGLETR